MVIDAIDHLAYSSENFFSRASIWLKFLFVGTVIAGVTLTNDPFFLGLWYCSILAVLASTNLPFFRLIELTLYSLVFVIVFGFGLSWSAPIFIASIFKVLATSTSLVLLAASTPYPAIFKSLGRIISQELAAILMLTYRSLFLLFRVFEDTLAIMRLRGAFSTRKPLVSLVNITSALGLTILKALDLSEKLHETMRLRGFHNQIYCTASNPALLLANGKLVFLVFYLGFLFFIAKV